MTANHTGGVVCNRNRRCRKSREEKPFPDLCRAATPATTRTLSNELRHPHAGTHPQRVSEFMPPRTPWRGGVTRSEFKRCQVACRALCQSAVASISVLLSPSHNSQPFSSEGSKKFHSTVQNGTGSVIASHTSSRGIVIVTRCFRQCAAATIPYAKVPH